ncbi:ATP-grasp domain-containing protein [Methanothrix soehngenii]|uniref:ATP-grasp domain-containing protein n=1 Tax=Methanothrix soehngenii TaxID=2223 RepID=UPI002A3BB0C8|nr:ATP-grasp domain-containing protein [Methanothrix soehngenii]
MPISLLSIALSFGLFGHKTSIACSSLAVREFMDIFVAEYASALGLGGTHELEGRAMLSCLVESFASSGHEVAYPTSGPRLKEGKPIMLGGGRDFGSLLQSIEAEACLLIAPDGLQPHFLEIIEGRTANLGSSPAAASLAADKLLSTQALARSGVPVAEIVDRPDPVDKGCLQYVVKPRTGSGSEGVRISSFVRAGPEEIVTRYHEGLHLSASFIVGKEGFLPLTLNRQLIDFADGKMRYQGSQVPYRTPRAAEIWEAAEKAADVLALRGYAGIDYVLGERPWAVDVNARPTTSIIGIARVMKEEIGELILQAKFGGMPERVHVTGEYTFLKGELG